MQNSESDKIPRFPELSHYLFWAGIALLFFYLQSPFLQQQSTENIPFAFWLFGFLGLLISTGFFISHFLLRTTLFKEHFRWRWIMVGLTMGVYVFMLHIYTPESLLQVAPHKFFRYGNLLIISANLFAWITLSLFSLAFFLSAILKTSRKKLNQPQATAHKSQKKFILIKSDKQLVKIHLKDILYIKAANYMAIIYTTKGTIIPNSDVSLSSIEKKELIPLKRRSDPFIRIHRSYIVNLDKIDRINQQFGSVQIGTETIPVGVSYREKFKSRIQSIHQEQIA